MNTKRIKLAIIDDAPLLSNGLLFMLQGYNNLEVVTNANTTGELLHHLRQKPADILLLDILRYMQADQLVKKVKEKFPGIKVLVLTMNNHDKDMVLRVLNDPDIDGYLSDNASSRILLTALEKIALGGTYYSDDIPWDTYDLQNYTPSPRLTDRELEIIRLIEREYNNREIAHTLFISERTVETHRKHIYKKTSTRNVIGLVKYAYVHRLVD